METTAEATLSVDAPQQLLQLIKQLLLEQQYDGLALLFTSEKAAPRNVATLELVANEVLHEVCLPHLTDDNYEQQLPLYNCAEQLLILLATHGPAEELLLEFLELVEEQKSDNVFTSALKALQAVLLRVMATKPRSLEWSLNSVLSRLMELPLPELLTDGYDLKQQRLLEQDAAVERLLMNYVTVGLFYEPLLAKALQLARESEAAAPAEKSRYTGIDCRNVLCCFLLQLLNKPLALLNLAIVSEPTKSNMYTAQCARNITKAISECLVDPFYLLQFVERRVRWQPQLDAEQDDLTAGTGCENIFLVKEKLPLPALAIYYYMLLVEQVTVEELPTLYAPLYIYEAGIYLSAELLTQPEPALQYRGVLLAQTLHKQLKETQVPVAQLQLELHERFAQSLCQLVGYAAQLHIRQQSVQLLRAYILQFDDVGKLQLLRRLLRSVTHTGICGYLATMYKDLVAAALRAACDNDALHESFAGDAFRALLLECVCQLPDGVYTDLIEHSDQLIAALNTVRFFAINDLQNRTGFWNFVKQLERDFMDPLRQALDFTCAHYKAELQRVEECSDEKQQAEESARLQLLDLQIANAVGGGATQKLNLSLERKRKLEVLRQQMCALDLIRSLLARACECVESTLRKKKQAEKAAAAAAAKEEEQAKVSATPVA